MLSDKLNYMDIIEYEALKKDLENDQTAENLVRDQIGKLIGFESKDSFTHFEEKMLEEMFGIIVGDEDRSVAKYFAEVKDPDYIKTFADMALYSEMVNYCTIKRMETENVAEGQCFCKEYLVNRIREFDTGAFNIAIKSNSLIVPIILTFHKPRGIYKYIRRKPLVHLNILKPYKPTDKEIAKNELYEIMNSYFLTCSNFDTNSSNS
jgi:hypothetical protein